MSHSAAPPLTPGAAALLAPWPGPCGGLPPFEHATPEALAQALPLAVEAKRRAVRSIADNPEPPAFDNTVAALEDSARSLRDLHAVFAAVSTTAQVGAMPEVAQRLAALVPALELEIAHDGALFSRIDAVWQTRESSGLDAQQIRLVEVLRARMVRAGAALGGADQARLQAIDARLATLSARFNQNLLAEQETQVVWLAAESDLDGLPPARREAAAAAARARGRAGAWAILNQRPAVWPFLTHARRRDLRETVWRMWSSRGSHPGAHDNRPLIAEMLRLRGERARLLGSPSHAHWVLADRMAGTPETALAMLMRAWDAALAATRRQIADYQAIADAEGADFALAPWDRLHYAEKLRQQRFAVDGEQISRYLSADRMLEAMFWAAGRLHGLGFSELTGVPVLHPSVRVFEVRRDAETIGVLYVDLYQRPGKMHGSHQHRLRAAERFRGRVLPIASIVSGVPVPPAGTPALLPWEYANVLFHEFGHALHMLLDGARYPSLGSLNVAWDMVELPSLLNEYWLRDRELLHRFARHHETGAPMPQALIERLEAALAYDRIFSVNLDYLGAAIVDIKLHLLADGSGGPIDALAVEQRTLQELGMPACWDLVLGVTHSVHSFAGSYDAGLYAYLWSDAMAAEVATRFANAPGGLYDRETAQAWREQILAVGHQRPARDAFRALLGHDPDLGALLRRFALQ
ncbi:MAG: M3 family metallopeptidase [Burkholderiaceae bacterium]|nr:M3 family metallopeptidase [Burkholderiaceae bacterium]